MRCLVIRRDMRANSSRPSSRNPQQQHSTQEIQNGFWYASVRNAGALSVVLSVLFKAHDTHMTLTSLWASKLFVCFHILVIRLVSCRFTAFLSHSRATAEGKKRTESHRLRIMYINFESLHFFSFGSFSLSFHLQYFYGLTPNLGADPRITLWCLWERVQNTHTLTYM